MKYCLRYSNRSKVMIEKAEEVAIYYNKNEAELPKFLEKHKNQRIILVIRDENDIFEEIKKLNLIQEAYNEQEIAVCLYALQPMEMIKPDILAQMGKLKMPWFTGRMATTWAEVNYLCQLGVSDIYVAEELCFELPAVAKLCHKRGITIRAIPNVAQSSVRDMDDELKFFIRPDDIDLYEGVIDVIEFWGELRQQDTFYKIYTEQKKWFGNLKEIISSLDNDFDNRCVLPIFGKSRLDCGQKCLKGGHCSICKSINSIADKLHANNLILTKEKNS